MSYQVIARKYRPQRFEEVVGQPLITETLKNAIQANRVAHGYIFSGPRGVGKTTTARILAKALNCAEGPTVTPCGKCPSCTEIAAGNSVDVLEIDAASNRGIDEIRELRETVRYLPARDRNKVFIIDEVHMLTTEAFNALLKTLEEPPPRSLFILATTEAHKLPSTIQSRCQHFAFRLLDYGEIVAQLERVAAAEKIKVDEGSLAAVAQAAQGSLRDALSVLDQVIAACGERLEEARVRKILGIVPAELMADTLAAIHAGSSSKVLERVAQLAAEGYELGHFCGELTRFVRNLMVARACGAASPLLQVPNDERKLLEKLAPLFSEEDLSRFFQILLRAESELRYSLDPRFHIELALLKLVHAGRLVPLERLLAELGGAAPEQKAPSPGGRARTTAGGSSEDFGAARTPGSKSASAAGDTAATNPGPAAAPQPAPAPRPREEPADDRRLASIKALVFNQSKFLGHCLESVVGWRFESGEVRFLYSKKDSWAVDALQSREQQEKLRSACAQVLGQPVKIYVTLDEDNEGPAAQATAQERAGQDERVRAFQKRFDCTWMDVKDLSQE